VVTLKQCIYTIIICTVIGLVAGAILWWFRSSRREPAGLDPDDNRRPAGMARSEWRATLRDRRIAWRTPRIETLERPAMSMARRIGLLTLRAYIIFAIVIMVIKLVQVTTAH
jgi:hypothetical protein